MHTRLLRYSGIRHTLIWLLGTAVIVGLFVLVPLAYMVPAEEGDAGVPDLFRGACVVLLYGVALWLSRHCIVYVGGKSFNLHQAYAPSGYILQSIIKLKNELCLFFLCIVLVPVAASLLKAVSYHHVTLGEEYAAHGIQCYAVAFPPITLDVAAPTPAPKYMHDDDDIIRQLFKISLDCGEPVIKLVQVFVAGMGVVLLCVLLLLAWIVKASVAEMGLYDDEKAAKGFT